MKVLLHVPHQSLQKLDENNVFQLTLYSHYLDTINTDPNDMLRYPIDNEEEFSDKESLDELIEDDDVKEF